LKLDNSRGLALDERWRIPIDGLAGIFSAGIYESSMSDLSIGGAVIVAIAVLSQLGT